MTHLLIEPSSHTRLQTTIAQSLCSPPGRTKEWMLHLWYMGAGCLAMVDKYYNPSYQKTIIIIMFPTCPAAWSLLSMHQAITPSIILFYNTGTHYILRPGGYLFSQLGALAVLQCIFYWTYSLTCIVMILPFLLCSSFIFIPIILFCSIPNTWLPNHCQLPSCIMPFGSSMLR